MSGRHSPFTVLTLTGFAALSFITQPAPAQTPTDNGTLSFPYLAAIRAQANGDEVAVRSGAAHTYYPFGMIEEGDLVRVVEHKFNWARIAAVGQAFDGFFGYLKYPISGTNRFRVEADGKSGLTLGRVDILAPNMDENNMPGDSWKPLIRLNPDETVIILSTIQTEREIIHTVALPEQSGGWISLDALRPATQMEITTFERLLSRARETQPLIPAPVRDPDDALIADAITAAETVTKAVPRVEPVAKPGADPGAVVPVPTEKSLAMQVIRELPPVERETASPQPSLIPSQTLLPLEPAAEVQQEEQETEFPVDTSTTSDRWNNARTIISDNQEISIPPIAEPEDDETVEQVTDDQLDPQPQSTTIDELAEPVNTIEQAEVFDAQFSPEVPKVTPIETTIVTDEPPAPLAVPERLMPDVVITEQITNESEPLIDEIIAPEPKVLPTPQQPVVKIDLDESLPFEKQLEQLDRVLEKMFAGSGNGGDGAEVEPLQALYQRIADRSKNTNRSVTYYAETRVEHLQIWVDLHERKRDLDRLRHRAMNSVEEIRAVELVLQSAGQYDAVGVLMASTIYDGENLPRLFRLQDPGSGRTIAYVQPAETEDRLTPLLGQLVGVVGRKNYDGGLRLTLIEPDRVDVLAPHVNGDTPRSENETRAAVVPSDA